MERLYNCHTVADEDFYKRIGIWAVPASLVEAGTAFFSLNRDSWNEGMNGAKQEKIRQGFERRITGNADVNKSWREQVKIFVTKFV